MTKEELRDYYREYSKERYEWRKSHKICIMCGLEKAVEGMILCEACRKKNRARAQIRRETATAEQKEQKKQYWRERYKKLVENGICPRCRRPLQENRKLCSVCLEKIKQQRAAQRKTERRKNEQNNSMV